MDEKNRRHDEKLNEQIRIAGIEDVAALTEFTAISFRESWLDETNGSDIESYIADNFNFSQIEKEITSELLTYLIFEMDNSIVGYCKLEKKCSPAELDLPNPIFISRLYVKKEYHNKQLGSRLINDALLLAKNENYKTIWLGVWSKSADGIRLYERFGFKKFGTEQFLMGSLIFDDYLMTREV